MPPIDAPPRVADEVRGARPAMPRPVKGRRAVIASFLVFGGLFGLALIYAFAGDWRQRDRLLADGLRAPRAAIWMPDEGVVVVEARPGDTTGLLTWFSTGSARSPIVDVPSAAAGDPDGGVVGVAATLDGRLIVAVGHCAVPLCNGILAPDPGGNLSKVVDFGGFGIGRPWGIATDPLGVAYVADRANDRVVGFDLTTAPGRLVDSVAVLAGSGPRGVAFEADGATLIALSEAGSVVRARPNTPIETVATGLGAVTAIAVEANGDILALEASIARGVVDRPDAGRLLRIYRDGRAPEILRTGMDRPSAITRTPDGRVYVTIRGFDRDPNRAGQLIQLRRFGPIAPRRIV